MGRCLTRVTVLQNCPAFCWRSCMCCRSLCWRSHPCFRSGSWRSLVCHSLVSTLEPEFFYLQWLSCALLIKLNVVSAGKEMNILRACEVYPESIQSGAMEKQRNLLKKIQATRNVVHRTMIPQSPSKQAPWDLTQFSQSPLAALLYFPDSH